MFAHMSVRIGLIMDVGVMRVKRIRLKTTFVVGVAVMKVVTLKIYYIHT
jgi:hypothetical protein